MIRVVGCRRLAVRTTTISLLFLLSALVTSPGCKKGNETAPLEDVQATDGPSTDQFGKDGAVPDTHVKPSDALEAGGDFEPSDVRGDGPEEEGLLDVYGDFRPETADLVLDVWLPTLCKSHEDCEGNGMCVEAAPGTGKMVCAPFCIEECPSNWECKSVYVGGPDPVSLCMPPVTTLCLPCTKTEECLFAGALCVPGSGALGYCGSLCHPQEAPDCPEGFACAMALGKKGEELGYQCLAAAGSCCVTGKLKGCEDNNPCTAEGCDPSKGCTHAPVDAVCAGEAPCTEYLCMNGACIGVPITLDPTPDGIDDDCDGETDEDWVLGFKVTTWSLAATAPHEVKGGSITVRGTLSTPPAGPASAQGDFKVTPGMIKTVNPAEE
jgi:hypothetical protein